MQDFAFFEQLNAYCWKFRQNNLPLLSAIFYLTSCVCSWNLGRSRHCEKNSCNNFA